MKLILSLLTLMVMTPYSFACDCDGEAGQRWINDRNRNPITGGCVGDGVYVSESTFIAKDSKVCGGARVKGRSLIVGNSTVTGTTRLNGTEVFNGAYLTSGSYGNEEVDGAQMKTTVTKENLRRKIDSSFAKLKKLTSGVLKSTVYGKGRFSSSTGGRFGRIDCEDYSGTYIEEGYCRIKVEELKKFNDIGLSSCQLRFRYHYARKVYGRVGLLDTQKTDVYGMTMDFQTMKWGDYEIHEYEGKNYLKHYVTGDRVKESLIGLIRTKDYYVSQYWQYLEDIATSCNQLHGVQ